MLRFQKQYFFLSMLLFSIEALIAAYIDGGLIRAYLGDILVVILLYCAVRSFFNLPALKVCLSVLLFSFIVETLQYFNIVTLLGLKNFEIAKIVIGTSFSWIDIGCYVLGTAVILAGEQLHKQGEETNTIPCFYDK